MMRSETMWLLVGERAANGSEGIDSIGLVLIKFAADVSCCLEICSSIPSSRATLINGVLPKIWTKAANSVLADVFWAVSLPVFTPRLVK